MRREHLCFKCSKYFNGLFIMSDSQRAGRARAPAEARNMLSAKGVLAPGGGGRRRDLADVSGDLPLQTGDQSQFQRGGRGRGQVSAGGGRGDGR